MTGVQDYGHSDAVRQLRYPSAQVIVHKIGFGVVEVHVVQTEQFVGGLVAVVPFEERAMSGRAPDWDAGSANVLMEYLKRASPQFIEAELDELDLLDAADEAAASILENMTMPASRHARASVWMVALAMCAMLGILAETLHVGAINVLPEDGGKFMQLAGPTSEW